MKKRSVNVRCKPDLITRMLDGLGDELRPLLDRLLIEAQGTPALATATEINELLIARGIVPRQAIVTKVPKLSERRQAQMRYVVREAERKAEAQWRQSGIARTNMPLDEKRRQQNDALTLARKLARDELHARWAEEDAAREAPLPRHITRLSTDDVPRETIDAEHDTPLIPTRGGTVQ